MRKRKREHNAVKKKRLKRAMRRAMQINKLAGGLREGLTLTQIHQNTGMAQKTIRKIMKRDPSQFTFLMLKRKLKE